MADQPSGYPDHFPDVYVPEDADIPQPPQVPLEDVDDEQVDQ